MRTERLVETLYRDLKPVRHQSVVRDAAILCVVGVVELAAFLSAGLVRPDMHYAMLMPSFWWKMGGMGVIAISAATVALTSLDPTRSPRAGLRWLTACIAVIFATDWFIDSMQDGLSELARRLDWAMGIKCTWKMVVLSVPAVFALGIPIRRGAPTDRSGTALAAALGSAAWGAFVFVFACPSDDPLYIAVWYTVGCGLVTVVGRSILFWLSRW
jgi:hypothetical protein